ncbi:ABC transporter permease [Mangrovibacterium diazotrophicum]|uniref:FtsX-like permease family protein n=1 Tax=Mangrovibacterium diazotrophicum TaxID=1261403 RepID=A0A419W3G4_9BACT|nr:ABC transporter permease [Mangrovibacterium diazotrophicum]RKD89974.1 FtsX-like permease family protein [Mangrovibacterium diazotrophicum]
MSIFRYVFNSLIRFWKLNLTILVGVALSTAILLGALMVGDTVSWNLKKISLQRLGYTQWTVSGGERLFRSSLVTEMDSLNCSPALFTRGMAVVGGGQARANHIQVWGIDSGFNRIAGTTDVYTLSNNEAVLNEQLANILGIKVGEELMLRVNRLSEYPANTPFVSADENTVAFRVIVKAIVFAEQCGNFNLQPIQSAPGNVFVSLDWLNRQMKLRGKANLILGSNAVINEQEFEDLLSKHWTLDDMNLQLFEDSANKTVGLRSERVFLDQEPVKKILSSDSLTYPVLTYFVNQFEHEGQITPYSFVSGIPSNQLEISENEMLVNDWLAEDLNVKKGDSIELHYFEVGPLRQLIEKQTSLRVAGIVPLSGKWADQQLMPQIPGLSDAGHCSDWETGVPVDLSLIRPKDENYWNTWKGTPKAFVRLETAQKLWGNSYGEATAVYFGNKSAEQVEKEILSSVSPADLGFQINPVREDGLKAASQGVDFGGLFIGLSFFVLFAALLLAWLMFKLYLNFRTSEIGTLHAIGFRASLIRRLFFDEALAIVVPGIALGIPLGILYNSLILDAINSIWRDIVRTSVVEPHLSLQSILVSITSILLICMGSVWFILRRVAKQSVVGSQREQVAIVSLKKRNLWIGLGLNILAFALMLAQGIGKEIQPEIFFTTGFLLLPGLLFLADFFLLRLVLKEANGLSFGHFSKTLTFGDRRRNNLTISFLSIGIFLVLSTGLFRQDLTSNADKASSGTGGYPYFAETSFPVLFDLNTKEGRFELGLEEVQTHFVQFQSLDGTDASCLNLNRVHRPRVLGFDPAEFNERNAFTFASTSEELDGSHPWLTLKHKLKNGAIPAIADASVIQWSLGKAVGDTLVYQNESGQSITLQLVGGLANSVFQGNILIGDSLFRANFPSVSGSSVFLIDAPADEEADLKSAFRNYGMDLSTTTDRLLLFYQIENTYLNIFLMLGALGLLIGTIGLAIVIFRSLMEQRSTFALLEAVGFTRQKIRNTSLKGHLFLVFQALLIGFIPSLFAGLPAILSGNYGNLIFWSLLVFGSVLFSAWFWTFIGHRLAMRGKASEALRNE